MLLVWPIIQHCFPSFHDSEHNKLYSPQYSYDVPERENSSRNLQGILWWMYAGEPMRIYELATVTYGPAGFLSSNMIFATASRGGFP